MGKRIAPALGLFFLSPLIGEFLLGNLPVTMLVALITLAPLYGGGALLVRELARRRGVGWPGIVLLAVAYGLIEEGLVTRSLFNPGFAGMDLRSYAWIPGVEVSAWWTVFVLGVHVVGSICVPIAVMESLVPARASEPWLRRPGLVVAGCCSSWGRRPRRCSRRIRTIPGSGGSRAWPCWRACWCSSPCAAAPPPRRAPSGPDGGPGAGRCSRSRWRPGPRSGCP
ncbi:hypothetical protein ACFQE7_24530 [Nonomuraea ferruginea]|uniref:hypothetical protein n=1 Tax=Nonomuraea ferruginea TaxID=46174 RepID=UPI00361BE341